MGGSDPNLNPRLATAIVNAKRGALSKTSIDSAIAKGQGKSASGAALEALTVEALLPCSVAAIIECQTDQKLRVLQDIRYTILRAGGTLTPTSYFFEKKGRLTFEQKEGISADDVLEVAVEAGALEVDMDDNGQIVVDTEPNELSAVGRELSKAFGLSIESSSIIHDAKPDTAVSLGDKDAQEVENIITALEEDPSVQDVYVNIVQ